jgi:aminopeptidase N
LHALERVVGPEVLTTFLREWFERHAFAAVTTADFERELAAASRRDLHAFFAGFVYRSYHPEVRVTFAPIAGGGEVDIRVDQLQTKGPAGGFSFPLDVDLVDADGRAERFVVDISGKNTTKRVHPAHVPQSLLVDPDEMMVGTVVCDASCRDGFRCAAGAVRVCVPR